MSEDNDYSNFASYDDNGNVVGGSNDNGGNSTPAPMAGWYDDLWGSYNNFVDRRYDYRTDPSKLPKFDDFVGAQQKAHADHFGVPLNRPWNADVDIARAKTETIDAPFLAAVEEYNSLYGTNYQVDPAFLGANSRSGVNPYMDSQPMRNRNESGFFKQGPGRALLAAAAIAAGGWGLAGLAEGAGAMASADAIGLAQMGQAAGLTGSALSEFVASGGTLGSTAAGVGGAVAGSMPNSYWSMLADSSGAGAPSAAAGTMNGLGTVSSTGNLSLGNIGAGSLLGGQAGSVVAGGAGALGLSAETVAAMQALGYSGAEIASMGGNVLNGFTATQALSAGGSAPLSVFDKFLNGILDNPIRSALSAGQILSGISTANRAMSPQQAQAMADPFSPYRQQYINQLNAVMANPALAMSQPGYQFQRQQGEQAIDRKLAARGMGSYTPDGRGSASGGADIARMKYGQEYALGSYNNYVKQLSELAGATQAPGVGGQAALTAQTAAARAATEGWGAINQGIGTADKIMQLAPSGNPNNSGWSTPAISGAGAGESIMASGYGANLAASNPWSGGPEMPRGYTPPGFVMSPFDVAVPLEEAMTQDWYINPNPKSGGGNYNIGWD